MTSEPTLSFYENLPDGFLAADQDGIITYINERGALLLRRLPTELLGARLWEQFTGGFGLHLYHQCNQVKETGASAETEIYYAQLCAWFKVRICCYEDGFYCFFRDITSIKQMRRSHDLFGLIDAYGKDIILVMDFQGKLLEANQAAVKAYGYSKAELLKLTIFHLRVKSDQEIARMQFNEVRSRNTLQFTTVHTRKDGTTFPAEVGAIAARVDGQMVVVSHIVDISARRETEEALINYNRRLEIMLREQLKRERQADERFVKLFQANPAIMGIHDLANGRYIDVNDGFVAATGFGRWEVHGKTPVEIDLCSQSDMAKIESYIDRHEQIQNLEINFRTKAGEVRTGLLSAVFITVDERECILSVTTDITELRSYERELLRLDRLNLVGQMAASIGHEVRNPMTTVRGYLQMLRNKEGLAGYSKQFALMIEELDRANHIITEFLSLARNKTNDRRLLDINELISAVLPLIQADALEAGRAFSSWPGAVDFVLADAKEVNQLLLNLIRNAIEATERNDKIILETYQTGSRVILAVENNGPPIPPHILATLGTPFCTTKENGTGLGLPICYSIAARNNAEIRVLSIQDCTRFEVVFQAAGYETEDNAGEIAGASVWTIPPVTEYLKK